MNDKDSTFKSWYQDSKYTNLHFYNIFDIEIKFSEWLKRIEYILW
jgi:hypothetical protein